MNESFNGRFRDECLNRELLGSVLEAQVLARSFRDEYNEIRPHIREQFPVPVPLTWLICKKRKWTHPYYKKEPAVLTVDFLVNLRRGGWVGIDFKKEKDLDSKLTERKLDIVAEALRLAGASSA